LKRHIRENELKENRLEITAPNEASFKPEDTAENENQINQLKQLGEENSDNLQEVVDQPQQTQSKADALLVAALMGSSIAKFKTKYKKYQTQFSEPTIQKHSTLTADSANIISYNKSKSVIEDGQHAVEIDASSGKGKSKNNNANNKPALNQDLDTAKPTLTTSTTSTANSSKAAGSKASKCIILFYSLNPFN
jgi:hypothetical protein